MTLPMFRFVAFSALALLAPFGYANQPNVPPAAQGLERDAELAVDDLRMTPQELRQLEEARAKDRAELVKPPPPGFKPEASGRRLKLTLVPKKTAFRVGDRFWYRLELMNVSSAPIRFSESESFFKSGHFSSDWEFLVDGAKVLQFGPFGSGGIVGEFSPPGFKRLTPEQKDAYVKRLNRESHERQRRERTLEVTLAPGETLVTRPWAYLDGYETAARMRKGLSLEVPVKGPYRELGEFRFRHPGRTTIKVERPSFEPRTLTEDDLRAMEARGVPRERTLELERRHPGTRREPLESNVVVIDVQP